MAAPNHAAPARLLPDSDTVEKLKPGNPHHATTDAEEGSVKRTLLTLGLNLAVLGFVASAAVVLVQIDIPGRRLAVGAALFFILLAFVVGGSGLAAWISSRRSDQGSEE